ncbi:MAG: CHAD domain-containing protein [Acidobacteriota bacterium]|nr:CHAD domain-containing protein [Acidobacteriota bacterium]
MPTIPGDSIAKPATLEEWMSRVIERADRTGLGFDIDDVHDLRVALRRCRTMADVLREVNPHAGWQKLKKTTSAAFHALGELRDVQVMSTQVKKLARARDPVRRHMLRRIAVQEKHDRQRAAKALDDFDRKHWKRLARKLGPEARFFPLESVVFQRIALARLNQAAECYQQARRKRSSAAWHSLRVALKRFRYTVDNFLPREYELWSVDLKRLQTLLGELHDLDVLRAAIRRDAAGLDASAVEAWIKNIDVKRKSLLAEINSRLSGPQSMWSVWHAGLRRRHTLEAAPLVHGERQSA